MAIDPGTLRSRAWGEALLALAGACVTLVALGAFSGSSSGDGQASASTPAQASAAAPIQVKAGEFFLRPSKKSIAKPGKITFVLRNTGTQEHTFRINGKTTPLVEPGKTATLAITFKKAGRYTFMCTVPGHAAAGMKGTFTVR